MYSPARGENLLLFATPMFRGFCPLDVRQIADDIRDIVSDIQVAKKGHHADSYTSYFHQDQRQRTHELPWFTDFANCMKDSYVEFIRTHYNAKTDFLNREDIHFHAWVNRYDGKNFHNTHDHVNSLVSGTFYVKTKGTEPIMFFSPNNIGEFATRAQMKYYDDVPGMNGIRVFGTPTMQHEIQVFPREGEFLLWPSHLLHTVPKPDVEKEEGYERISISFNLMHNEPLNDTEHGTPMSYEFLDR